MTDSLDVVFEFVEPVIEKLEKSGSDSLSELETTILSVWLLEADVNNGGFNQYFWNSSGDFANQVVSSLHKIGAEDAAYIVKAALANFPNSIPPRNRDERQNILETLEDSGTLKLDSLDTEFYECLRWSLRRHQNVP
ncbi:DMP19 family protein [uncultured Paraglaciecola sp.]|uniref:DMP19 family protein n=1 Tax=uncultured Paraglaciecola sp. TaxID=1765024 RepID=UPI0025927723|nr:DMP19 family protein [uncultured Paraglaciecola sp.]